jgi:ribosomal-protein-alanine N-acetyltransferase|tara:strand:- start:1707 stop:2144 length:438 start_codon:yes stop_codon:yes gene_type:complete
MDLQLASFGDLDKISKIEKETNEYPWSLNNFKSSLNAGNSSIVLKDKKNILGYAFFSVIGADSHLLNITVSKDFQGRGYGKKILDKVLFQSKVLGATVIFLEVRVSNYKAIDFYEKFGFKRDAVRYNYYDGSPREDALLMSKQGL